MDEYLKLQNWQLQQFHSVTVLYLFHIFKLLSTERSSFNVGLGRAKHLRTGSVTNFYVATMSSALKASSFALWERNSSNILFI
jgi:hypothetical protein